MVFVDAREQLFRRQKGRSTTNASGTKDTTPIDSETSRSQSITSTNHHSENQQITHRSPLKWSLSPSLDHVVITYTATNLCKGPMVGLYRKMLSCNRGHLSTSEVLLANCSYALAEIYFGLHSHDQNASKHGMGLYGKALRSLKESLEGESSDVTPEVIVSVFVLCMAEVCGTLFLAMTG